VLVVPLDSDTPSDGLLYSSDGDTPIHVAARSSCEDTVRLLVERLNGVPAGSSGRLALSIHGKDGLTPKDVAMTRGSLSLVRLLSATPAPSNDNSPAPSDVATPTLTATSVSTNDLLDWTLIQPVSVPLANSPLGGEHEPETAVVVPSAPVTAVSVPTGIAATRVCNVWWLMMIIAKQFKAGSKHTHTHLTYLTTLSLPLSLNAHHSLLLYVCR
jgi:hypothetical protein